mgnify:FL=1
MAAGSGTYPVLVVGNAVLDVILTVDHYPAEDEELRAGSRRLAVGGNAANSAQVLADLGHRVSLLATLAPDAEGEMLRQELIAAGVDCNRLVRCDRGHTPLSYILVNTARGTRTIVHHRELNELKLEDFQALPLTGYAWIHFEGRNVKETGGMLRHLRQTDYAGRISLEIEKDRPGLDALMPLAELLLFSRVFAEARGHADAISLLEAMAGQLPGKAMTCTWGEAGAWARDAQGVIHHVPAHVPPRVVDSLGAGDVFNAGMIHALLAGSDLAGALDTASRLAGQKVGMHGLRGLADPLNPPAVA